MITPGFCHRFESARKLLPSIEVSKESVASIGVNLESVASIGVNKESDTGNMGQLGECYSNQYGSTRKVM